MKRKLFTALFAAISAVAFMTAPVKADYPVSPVKLVTHSSAGGGTDVFLRRLATQLNSIMGTNFVVENITGGGGARAMAALVSGPKDGSQIYGTTPSYIITTLLSKPQAGYSDLDPILNMFYDPQVVFVRADSPYKNLSDIIEDAQQRPGRVIAAVSTPGSLDRQVMEQFKALTKTDVVILTHDGGGDVILNVLNGTANFGIGEIAELRGQIEAGAMRVITTYTEERVPVLENVPTAREQGIDLVVRKFRGLAGPKGLAPEIVSAWEEGVQKLLEDPEFKAWYEAEGVQKAFMNQEEARAFTAEFAEEMTAFFKEYNITD
ncbi:Bug family tripartite tricarboxylate transporter substrate binding protein [Pseudochelatococcus sp. B33]